MKIKSILLTAVATISLATATMAQVPNYLPTNGLVGWWPFNGNANDESGNGNNGIVNGPNLTSDRFGNIGNAYSFDGVNDYIEISNSLVTNSNTSFSIFGWFNCDYNNQTIDIISDRTTNNYNVKYRLSIDSVNNGKLTFFCFDGSPNLIELMSNLAIVSNLWNNFTITFDQQNLEYKLYVNGILQQSLVSSSILSNNNTNATQIGRLLGPSSALSPAYLFDGNIDDIGIWNRALTQQEVTDLYNAVNCANNTNITPLTNNLNIGNAATFTATTSDPNPSYVWQSDLGQGFQTLNNFGNYSGVNTASLNIANVQLSDHNQPIRVISTSGNCIDTSNVAIIIQSAASVEYIKRCCVVVLKYICPSTGVAGLLDSVGSTFADAPAIAVSTYNLVVACVF